LLAKYIRQTGRAGKAALVLALMLCTSGCGTLNQQVKSSEPHAVLQFMPVKSSNRYYRIRKVDDRTVHAGWFFNRNYRVSPGEHELTFNEVVFWTETVSDPSNGLGLFAVALATTAAGVDCGSTPDSKSTTATFTRCSQQPITSKLNAEAGRTYVFDESGILRSGK